MTCLRVFTAVIVLANGSGFSGSKAGETIHSLQSVAEPLTLIVASDLNEQDRSRLIGAAAKFYEFWNSGDAGLLASALSADFTDQALPPSRPQGPNGPLVAIRQFKQAVPDLRCQVTQQIIAADRVVSRLRFTGHFSGTFGNLGGRGQKVDFTATDILRVNEAGRITDNWHLEDNLTFLRQIGAVKP